MTERILYIDPIGGIAGDMLCAALIDAGLNKNSWLTGLQNIPWSESVDLSISRVMSHAFSATHFSVSSSGKTETEHHQTPTSETDHNHTHTSETEHHHTHTSFVGTNTVVDSHHHRGLKEVEELIHKSDLPKIVQANAVKVFELLGDAESQIHGTTLDKVHFHEVGAIDSIIDILGFCYGVYLLNIDRIIVDSLPLSSGEIITEHGRTPLPAPATLRILSGWQTKLGQHNHEQVTPTGAAIVKTLGEYGTFPPMTIESDGFGAGTRNPSEYPNLVRVCIGTREPRQTKDTVIEIQCSIDDMSGELMVPLIDQLLKNGALDAHVQSITMKKGRQGQLFTILCSSQTQESVLQCLFKHSSTFGCRMITKERTILERQFDTVQTDTGPVAIKIGIYRNKVVQISVEYEDANSIAKEQNRSIQEVYRESLYLHQSQFPHRYST